MYNYNVVRIFRMCTTQDALSMTGLPQQRETGSVSCMSSQGKLVTHGITIPNGWQRSHQLLDIQAGARALGNVTVSDAASECATGKKLLAADITPGHS